MDFDYYEGEREAPRKISVDTSSNERGNMANRYPEPKDDDTLSSLAIKYGKAVYAEEKDRDNPGRYAEARIKAATAYDAMLGMIELMLEGR